MCGIIFIYGPKSLERVQYSLPKLIHRGPDDQQIIIGENMALGFTRLAINGVGKVGSQPMKFQEMLGAFNGEIYNHQSLSEKYNLPLSSSDTEIILPLFKKINKGILGALDGFFSGIIIDRNTSQVWTIRDHIGKKPLFIGRSRDNIFITSEIKVIDNIDDFSLLPLGLSSIDLESGSVKVISQHQSIQIEQSLVGIFENAVIKRLPPIDQPVGVFLSGGLDSSIVAAIVAKYRPDATYFTLGNDVDFDFTQEVVEALGLKDIRRISLPKESEMPLLIREVVKSTESFNPSIISNGLATYVLSKAVNDAGIKVVLGGEGADELFGGYHKFASADSNWKEIRNQLINDMQMTELRRLDLASMAHSVEVRCPFLDIKIRNFAESLDFEDLYEGEVNKVILRKSFKDFLPNSIIQRQKTSLDVGSGVRKRVVNYLSSNDQTERQGLKNIWNEIFEMNSEHFYFSHYPVFDEIINKRGVVHK